MFDEFLQDKNVICPMGFAEAQRHLVISERIQMRRLLRDPFVHFLLIGVLVFAVYGVRNGPSAVIAENLIEVTPDDVTRIAEQFRSVWRRPPREGEMRGLVDEFLRGEVYYRAALELGLDRGDPVIRQRLRQKMEFLTEAGAERLTPTDEQLRTFYKVSADRFVRPPRISFQQIQLSDEDDPIAAIELLNAGAAPQGFGATTLLPSEMTDAQPVTVDGTFGRGVFEALAAVPQGTWAGPIASSYGQHLVKVSTFEKGVLPSLEEVRPMVEDEWRRAEAERLREEQYRAMLADFQLVLPDEVVE
jgi:hypothetical protein